MASPSPIAPLGASRRRARYMLQKRPVSAESQEGGDETSVRRCGGVRLTRLTGHNETMRWLDETKPTMDPADGLREEVGAALLPAGALNPACRRPGGERAQRQGKEESGLAGHSSRVRGNTKNRRFHRLVRLA
jgi:hypothetical protein